jgi:pectate lyase
MSTSDPAVTSPAAITSYPALGFGQRVSLQPETARVNVSNRTTLKPALQALATASDTAQLLVLAGGTYDFDDGKEFTIRRRNLTITAAEGETVILKNVKLSIDVDTSDNVLIQNIVFRADGSPDTARDAISLKSLGSAAPAGTTPTGSVRITRCSFDGYFDIAVDAHITVAHVRLLATIDHCLFYDQNPGRPKQKDRDGFRLFTNRGAINVSSSSNAGNANVTIASNVFVDVWRRCPRVANGSKAHIYNNLLFRWGKGNTEDKASNHTNEWVGMVADNAAQCVIQANRFIPWKKKLTANKTINIDMRSGNAATVDIGDAFTPPAGSTLPATPDLTNDFDGANGSGPPPQGLPPTSGISHVDLDSWFTALALTPPPTGTVVRKDQVDWPGLVAAAGPPASGVGSSNIVNALTTVLVDSAAGHPVVPDEGDDPSDDENAANDD